MGILSIVVVDNIENKRKNHDVDKMSTFSQSTNAFRPAKGSKKSAKNRLQQGPIIKPYTRQTLTPNQIAGERLRKSLEKFPDTTQDLRHQLVDEMVTMDLLSTMNMDILAAALMFLHRFNDEINPSIFTPDNVRSVLFLKLTSDNLDMYAAYATDLLRYILKVKTFRNSR